MDVRMYVCIYVRMCVYIYMYVHARTYTNTSTYASAHTCTEKTFMFVMSQVHRLRLRMEELEATWARLLRCSVAGVRSLQLPPRRQSLSSRTDACYWLESCGSSPSVWRHIAAVEEM